MNLPTQIAQNLQALDFDASAQRNDIPELIHRYLLLIEKWNRIHNLTAIRNPADMLIQHIMDSLAVIPHITGPRVIDVGSGAGLPGLPIALAKPNWQIDLVESNQKKVSFLQQTKIELALGNVTVSPSRIEEFQMGGVVNTIITRAFSDLGEFIRLTSHLANHHNEDCRWVAMKANCSDAEKAQIKPPYYIETIVALTVPNLAASRELIIIKKTIAPD